METIESTETSPLVQVETNVDAEPRAAVYVCQEQFTMDEDMNMVLRDLCTAVHHLKTMTEAACNYIEILEVISSQIGELRTELPHLFTSVPYTRLPQEINNNVEDPREMLRQLIVACRTQVQLQSPEDDRAPHPMMSDVSDHTEDKDLQAEISKLREEASRNEKLCEELQTIKQATLTQQKKILDLENTVCSLQTKIAETERDLQSANYQKDENRTENSQMSDRLQSIAGWFQQNVHFSCELPSNETDDSKLSAVMSKFMQRVNGQMEGCDIDLIPLTGQTEDVGLPVIVPCIMGSTAHGTVANALSKAKVSNAQVILLIFHHRPKHQIPTATEKRVEDRTILVQCVGMVDAVFWQGDLYDCTTNQEAVRRVQQLFRWSVPLSHLQQLKALIFSP